MTKKPPVAPGPRNKGSGAAFEIDLSGTSTPQQIIFNAMLKYLDTPGLSLRELWRTRRLNEDNDTSPYYRDVIKFRTLEATAARGQWARRRQVHWSEIEVRVIDALQTSAVKREIAELTQLEAVESVLLSHIHGVTDSAGKVLISAAKPKSLEGAVGALVNLGKYRDLKRERINEDVAAAATVPIPSDGTKAIDVASIPAVEDDLNEEEIEAMAVAVAEQRAGIETDNGDSDGDE